MNNEVLKDKNHKILDPKFPRYEKFKNKMNDIFKFEYITSNNIDVPANANRAINIGSYHTPTGYKLLGFVPLNVGWGDQWQVTFGRYGGDNVWAYIKNYYAAQLTSTVSCTAIYIKSEYYNQNLVS